MNSLKLLNEARFDLIRAVTEYDQAEFRLFVALGSPRQEMLIERFRSVHPRGFYMGLGGSFDIYAGVKKRAPLWMQRRGLEWLFRFLSEPSRAPRETKRLKFLALLVMGKL